MLIALTAILVILIFIICGNKGAKSIISTAINAALLLAAVFLIYLGLPSVPVTLIMCVLVSAVTLFYQNEYNVKSKAAFLSVLLVIVVMIPLVYFLASGANGEGFTPENYEITDSNGYTRNISLDMLSMQISVMFIALIGVVTDTAVAITSSIYEIRANSPSLPLAGLLRSSFTVGRSVLATSIHTIFYIYIAEYMTLMMQYVIYYPPSAVLNSQSLAKEFISVSVSGIGCCLVVPAAAIIGALMIKGCGIRRTSSRA